jgi:hypothetical protein
VSHYSNIIVKFALALAIVVLIPARAYVATVRGLSLVDLVCESDVVIRGRAVSVRAFRHEWLGIVRGFAIEVDRRLAGDCPDRIEVLVLGGELETTATHVPGEAEIEVGDEVVLFLSSTEGDRFRISGMSQGMFRVMRDPRGGAAFATRELGAIGLVDPPEVDELGLARACTSTFVPLELLESKVIEIASAAGI